MYDGEMEIRMKKTNRRIYLNIFVLVAFVILVTVVIFLSRNHSSTSFYSKDLCIELNKGWIVSSDIVRPFEIDLPSEYSGKGSSYFDLENTLPDNVMDNMCLVLRGSQQDVFIFVDDELIYEYSTRNERIYGKTSVRSWLRIPMKEGYSGKKIRIRFQCIYDDYVGTFNSVYYGQTTDIVHMLISKYYFQFIVGAALIIIGIVSYGFNLTTLSEKTKKHNLFYLGTFSLFVGVWILFESRIVQFIFDDSFVINMIPFLAVLIIPVPLLSYINELENNRFEFTFKVLSSIAVLNFLLQIALYFSNIFDFIDMIFVSQAFLVIVGIWAIISVFITYSHNKDKELSFFGRTLIIMFIFLFSELIHYWCALSAAPLGNMLAIGVLISISMLTIHNIRRALREINERRDAIAANEAKTELLARISHELRTPLGIIIGMDDLIIEEAKDQLINEYAVNIKTSANTMLGLVNDILDISRIEAGKMELVEGEYYIQKMIEDMAAAFRVIADKKNLKFNVRVGNGIPDILFGDEMKIRQIISNILSNAIKYTPKGHVDFAITCNNEDDECRLIIAIADSGIGIDSKDFDSLFTSFRRLSKNMEIEGTGLGLSITKNLVDLLGGKLEVESQVGVGSCFTVEIPQKIVRLYKSEAALPSSVINNIEFPLFGFKRKVLVVDDNILNINMISATLKKCELKVDSAISGKRCIQLCEKNKYDLILLDHMMPEMDGVETFRNIRSNEKNLNFETPIIVVTANALSGMAEYYSVIGFSSYLLKPIDRKKMCQTLKDFIPQ